eukprot:824757-Prymnesium_polylepis.1
MAPSRPIAATTTGALTTASTASAPSRRSCLWLTQSCCRSPAAAALAPGGSRHPSTRSCNRLWPRWSRCKLHVFRTRRQRASPEPSSAPLHGSLQACDNGASGLKELNVVFVEKIERNPMDRIYLAWRADA